MDTNNVTSINGQAGALASSQNRVLRNTYMLLALSMVPTVAGAVLGVSIGFKGFGPWWMNFMISVELVGEWDLGSAYFSGEFWR